MDVLNEQAIYKEIVGPLLDRLRSETIPVLENAIADRVDSLVGQVSTMIGGLLVGAQGIEDKANSDARALLESLDGWHLVITLPPITITLTKPS